MKERIDKLLAEVEQLAAKREQEIEEIRVRLLGKKGSITQLFEEFRNVLPEQKKELGQVLNTLKVAASNKIDQLRQMLDESLESEGADFDLTKPGDA